MAKLSSYVNDLVLPAGESVTDLPGGCTLLWRSSCWICPSFGNYQQYCCFAFIVPTDAVRATFEAWGSGGGGGVNCCCMGGSPGGSGAYARKTISVSSGDCYDMCMGEGACCHNGRNGFRGCRSSIKGTGLSNFCADGGIEGCSYCFPGYGCYVTGYCNCRSWCCGCQQNSGTACAYGGDINICGVRGWWAHRSCGDHCCYKHYLPYPGGLVNKCGGTVGVGVGGRHFDTYVNCSAANNIGWSRLSPQYVPGFGGVTFYTWSGHCHCGSYGAPGMIRITWYQT